MTDNETREILEDTNFIIEEKGRMKGGREERKPIWEKNSIILELTSG